MRITYDKEKMKKVILTCICTVILMLICSKILTMPKIHSESIEYLTNKQQTVMSLSAGAATASVLTSAMIDDTGTHISEKLADLSWGFLIISVVIVLEKYLTLLAGKLACWLILLVGIAIAIHIISGKYDFLLAIAKKLTIFAIILVVAVPLTVQVSKGVDNLDNSIQEALTVSEELKDSTSQEEDFWSNTWTSIRNGISNVASFVEDKVTYLFEAFAIMIVTSCIIPILVLFMFLGVIKLLFGIEIKVKMPKRPTFKKQEVNEDI